MKVLIAIDGSPGSAAAIQSIAARPWPPNTAFRVFSSIQDAVPTPLPDMIYYEGESLAEANQIQSLEADHLAANAAAVLRKSGLRIVDVSLRHGNPGTTIIEESAEWDADWIVVGANDEQSRLKEWFLGSVVQTVVKHAPCSVEVVRRKGKEAVMEIADAAMETEPAVMATDAAVAVA